MPAYVAPDPDESHDRNQVYWIDAIYIIAILSWILLICTCRLYLLPGAFLLWVPIIVFGVALLNSDRLTPQVEESMFKATYISVGMILALPLLAWMSRDYQGDRNRFSLAIVMALTLTLLALIDVWVPPGWLCVHQHFRSCLQTASVTLLMVALISYYLARAARGLGIEDGCTGEVGD